MTLLLLIGNIALTACATRSIPPAKAPIPSTGETTPEQTSAVQTVPQSKSNLLQSPSRPAIKSRVTTLGNLTDSRLSEVSGLAVSTRDESTLWALNDSGNAAELYALNTQAQVMAVWRVVAQNRDWEALSAVRVNGESWLLIADTGDNLQRRKESVIHIVREPDVSEQPLKPLIPTHSLRFRYPDGAHNVEAVGVANEMIFLLTKERLQPQGKQRSRVYQIPFRLAQSSSVVVAELLSELQPIERTISTRLLTRLLNIDPLQPTDMAFSVDGKHALVLNYRYVTHYERHADETWAAAFKRSPAILHQHNLRQAESIAVGADDVVWFTSERIGAPLRVFRPTQLNKASRVSP